MPHRDAGFKARLHDAMDDARLRPKALADKLGVHPTSVSRWRRGEIPEAGALSALASALAVRMEWLKTGAGEQKARERGSEPYGVPEPASGPGRAREFY